MRGAALSTAFACTSLATPAAVAAGAIEAASEAAEADFNIRAQPADQSYGAWTRQNLLGDIDGVRPLARQVWRYIRPDRNERSARQRARRPRAGRDVRPLDDDDARRRHAKTFGVLDVNFTISALQMHGHNLSQYYHPRRRLRDTFVLGVRTNITF